MLPPSRYSSILSVSSRPVHSENPPSATSRMPTSAGGADGRERAARVEQADHEVVVQHRVDADAGRASRRSSPTPPAAGSASVISKRVVASRPTRRTMNSNGMAGATPTSASSRPRSRSVRRVVRPRRTGRRTPRRRSRPARAPRCQSSSRRLDQASVQLRARQPVVRLEHGPLGRRRRSAFSIISISRRTLTKRQSGSRDSVRAPKIRRPRPGERADRVDVLRVEHAVQRVVERQGQRPAPSAAARWPAPCGRRSRRSVVGD